MTCPVRFIALSFSLAPAINYGFDNVMAGSFRYMAVVRGTKNGGTLLVGMGNAPQELTRREKK